MRYLLILLILTSCVTERKRAKICNSCPEKITIERRDSIVNRDTTIYLPSKVLRDTIKIECDENRVPVISIKRPVKNGSMRMEVTRPDLNTLVSECIVDSEAVYITWKEKHTTIEAKEVLRDKPLFDYNYLWVTLAVLGVVYLAYKAQQKRRL